MTHVSSRLPSRCKAFIVMGHRSIKLRRSWSDTNSAATARKNYTFVQWRKPWGQWLFYGFGVWPWLPPCIPGSETGCCWSASRSEPLPYSAGVLQHHHALLGGLLVRFNRLSNNWIRSIPKPGFFPEYVGQYGQVANFPLTIHQLTNSLRL